MPRLAHASLSVRTISGILLVSAGGLGAQTHPAAEATGAAVVASTVAVAEAFDRTVPTRPEASLLRATVRTTDPFAEAAGPVASQARTELFAVTRDAVWSAPWLHRDPGTPAHVGRVTSLAGTEPADSRRRTALPWESIQIRTDGGGVAVGDLLQLFRERRTLPGGGTVHQPTGVARVTGVAGQTVTADLVALYGLARLGDLARPVPAYDLEAGERATVVEVSQEAGLLGFAALGNVHSYGGVAFLDRGLRDGVRVGDEFVAMAPDDLIRGGGTQARLQVVGVAADHTAARIVDLTSPVFDPDSRVLLDRSIR